MRPLLRRCAALMLLCACAQAGAQTGVAAGAPADAPNTSQSATSAAAPPTASAPATAAPATGAESTAADSKAATEQLPTVEVKGKRDVLGESDAKLRKLKESLPGLGDGAEAKDNLGQRIREKVVETVKKDNDANKRSPEGKQFMNRVMNPLDAHAGDPAATQTKEDFKDVYCGTDQCPH